MSKKTYTIVAVEDEPDLLFLLEKKLKSVGFKTVGFALGGQALEYLKKESADLVLLDILLPDIDGITILNELASDPATKKIPVIMLSNLADQGSFDQVAAVRNCEYLVKATTSLDEVVEHVKKKLKI